MTKTNTFLIKIRFNDYFFFGQGNQDRGSFGNSANYYLQSNIFPQQTGVRGFLRYLLLQMNDCLYPAGGEIKEESKEKAIQLIGKDSNEINADIGIIKNISPLLLFKDDVPLFYRPNEYVEHCPDHYTPVILKKNKGKVYSFLQKKLSDERESAFYLEGYNAKDGFAEGFSDIEGNFISIDDIYKKHLISGNRINEEGVPDDESYYKQEFLYLEKEYSFGCWVEFDSSFVNSLITPKDGLTIISKMGKEQSEVIVKFKKQKSPEFIKIKQDISSNVITKVLFISDAYVDSEFEKHCVFATNQTITFSYIKSSVNTKDYASLKNSRRTEKKILLKRGSVLYLKNNDTTFLNNDKFQKIGYNHYMKI